MTSNAGKTSWLFRNLYKPESFPLATARTVAPFIRMKTLYFAYGSNMNQEQMADAARVPRSDRCPSRRLALLHQRAGLPELRNRPIRFLVALVARRRTRRLLDRYEGVKGNFYSKETLEVEKPRMDRKFPPSFTSPSTGNTEFPLPVIRAWWSSVLEKSDCPPIT